MGRKKCAAMKPTRLGGTVAFAHDACRTAKRSGTPNSVEETKHALKARIRIRKVDSMAICAECGSVVPDTKKFCPGCGARIDSDDGRFSATMLDQDGNRVVVQSRRAQQQRRTLVPFDENKPVLNARSSRGQTKIAANRPNQVRKEATDIDGLLFDDDEYETVRQDRVAKRDSARLFPRKTRKCMRSNKSKGRRAGQRCWAWWITF